MPNVLVVRGHQAAPWSLRAWERLPARFDVRFLLTSRNAFDVSSVRLTRVEARALRSFMPRGLPFDIATGVAGDRYVGADDAFAWADVVHSEELSYWYGADAARRKPRHGYRLVLTVWETLPLLDAFRNRHARKFRAETIGVADRFLAASERARTALLLEGVEPERIDVTYPGVDVDRFADAARAAAPREHVLLSPGRLAWEKGHHDVMRAVAALRRGLVSARVVPRLVLVGSGPEEARLRAYARELGIDDLVEFRSVPYDDMPSVFAEASCLVLASLASVGCMFHPGDVPRCFWEEQFGMVIAEGMAAGLPLVLSNSGAIPEVAGGAAEYFVPGDWPGLAQMLAEGVLSRPPARVEHPAERVRLYSTDAAAERLAAAYDSVLSG